MNGNNEMEGCSYPEIYLDSLATGVALNALRNENDPRIRDALIERILDLVNRNSLRFRTSLNPGEVQRMCEAYFMKKKASPQALANKSHGEWRSALLKEIARGVDVSSDESSGDFANALIDSSSNSTSVASSSRDCDSGSNELQIDAEEKRRRLAALGEETEREERRIAALREERRSLEERIRLEDERKREEQRQKDEKAAEKASRLAVVKAE